MIKKSIIFIILIMTITLTLNSVTACTIGFSTNSPFNGKVNCSPCNDENKTCNCNFASDIIVTTATPNSLYTISGCEDYTVNFYMSQNDFFIKNDFHFSSNAINFTDNLVIDSAADIYVYEDAKNIELPNLIVESGKTFNIKTMDYLQATDKSHNLKIESIFVKPNSTLNLDVSSNDGISHGTSHNCNPPDHDYGTRSGDVNLDVNSTENYGTININLTTGNGGKGNSMDEEDCSGSVNQHGGAGGNSGNINFNMKYIINNNNFNTNLNTGNAGNGGYSSIDDSTDGDFDGGNAGDAGSINILPIKKIDNSGSLLLSMKTGNGGVGGPQRSDEQDDCEEGDNGNGGSGGNISDVNITTLQNKTPAAEFEIITENGKLGKVDTTPHHACYKVGDADFGRPGKLGNVNIDFLQNNSASTDNFTVTSIFNFTQADYDLALVASNHDGHDQADNGGNMRKLNDLNLKLPDIRINYLQNGSYLPKNISASTSIDNPEYFNNDVVINGCYINPTTVNYNVKDRKLILASNPDTIQTSNPSFDLTYRYCPHCEIMDLADEVNRYTKQYNIYSNIDGNILPGDLNIYYSDPSNSSIYYTKRTDEQLLPVYTNKEAISSIFNEDIATNEYVLDRSKLLWNAADPEDDRADLENDEYLFCYGQDYIIKGEITTPSGLKTFEFPFTPLRDIFND